MQIPTLTTDRLMLSAPERADFDAYADMLASPRTKWMGGPYDRAGAWAMFASQAAHWVLDGFGGWMIKDRKNGMFLGDMTIWQPQHYAEPELGWTLAPQAEGRGIAQEAARLALDWYWANFPAHSIVSYITPGNTRSEALARRLGAQLDRSAKLPVGETAEETMVFRHRRPQ